MTQPSMVIQASGKSKGTSKIKSKVKTGKGWQDLSPEVQSRADSMIDDLRRLCVDLDAIHWQVGDLAIRIESETGLALRSIHARTKPPFEYAYFTEIVKACRDDSCKAPRENGTTAREVLSCAEVIISQRQYGKIDPEDRQVKTLADFALMSKAEGKSARQIRTDISNIRIDNYKKECTAKAQVLLARYPILNQNCFNEDCREVLKRIAETGSKPIRLLHADPPYSNYLKAKGPVEGKRGKRNRDQGGDLVLNCGSYAPMRTECANATRGLATKLAIDLVTLAPDVLAEHGVLLLWQAGLLPDRWSVVKAIEDRGLMAWAMTVPKPRTQPTDFSRALSFSSERLLVIFREGEFPMDLSAGTMSRRDALNPEQLRHELDAMGMKWATGQYSREVQQGKRKLGDGHVMAKPPGVNEFLIEKFSCPGELIFDACGCSGGMCYAAERMKRRWMYCEEVAVTHDWGVVNIAKSLTSPTDETPADAADALVEVGESQAA